MKNKLKILFAYFRNLSDSIHTNILLDREYIEDWDGGKFRTSDGNYFTPPESIIKIIEELIAIYYHEFKRYVNFEYDEYWYLYVTIEPKSKILIFNASSKEEISERFRREYEYQGLDEERRDIIDYLYSEFPDTAKINFEGYGRWGDGEVYELHVDGKQKNINGDLEDKFWNLAYYFMSKINGSWWNDGPGGYFDITIWNDDIFVSGNFFEHEYQDTGMSIEVTPDNVEENDKE